MAHIVSLCAEEPPIDLILLFIASPFTVNFPCDSGSSSSSSPVVWSTQLRTARELIISASDELYMVSATASAKAQDKPIVFVVDDDVSVRESLELLIRFEAWQPETFASAEEFLARPRVSTPNCLVLDVSLPDLNGLELQKLIATDRVDMPIIFITGHGDIPMTVRR